MTLEGLQCADWWARVPECSGGRKGRVFAWTERRGIGHSLAPGGGGAGAAVAVETAINRGAETAGRSVQRQKAHACMDQWEEREESLNQQEERGEFGPMGGERGAYGPMGGERAESLDQWKERNELGPEGGERGEW